MGDGDRDELDAAAVASMRLWHEAVTGFISEVSTKVTNGDFQGAYLIAGGPLLATATRIGWPAADVFLGFVMAVRHFAHLDAGEKPGAPDWARAHEEYQAALTHALCYALPVPPEPS